MKKRPPSSRESCTCSLCVGCCERRPGWMKPGEAERMAEFLGLSLQELFRQYLAVDWYVDDPDVFLFSPAIVGGNPGTEMPANPAGRCVFLTEEGRCRVHPVKPFECAVAWCGDGPVERAGSAHQVAADAWRASEHQAQIVALLGREPDPKPFTFLDFMGWL